MNILLTGATGVLGSHILYELLFLFAQKVYKGKITIVCRSSKKLTALQRITKILDATCIPQYLQSYSLRDLLSYIDIIDKDLENIIEKDIAEKTTEKYYLIHAAASTDLRDSVSTYNELYQTNYLGTLKLLQYKKYIHKFVFVSTIFSCGIQEGQITDDFLALTNVEYRNPYETLKARTENELALLCEQHDIELQIVRPSIICGRLIHMPLFFIPKFNVFYLYLAFFYRAALYRNDHLVRIWADENSQINIVPVDYVAKIITESLPMNIKQLNIPGQDIDVYDFVNNVMKFVNYDNFQIVNTKPEEKGNSFEHYYYENINTVFGKYVTSPKLFYVRHPFLQQEKFRFDVNNQLQNLCDFAKSKEFKDYKL